MQKNNKKIWCLLIVFLLLELCYPIHISAAEATYYTIPSESYDCFTYVIRHTGTPSLPNKLTAYMIKMNPSSEVRSVGIYDSSTKYLYFYFISANSMNTNRTSVSSDTGSYACSVGSQNGANGTLSNGYYVLEFRPYTYQINDLTPWESDIPILTLDTHSYDLGIYYTFGEGASAGSPDYGELIDLGFYTNFTNSQQSNYYQMRYNKDTIQWNGYVDSNGNQINTLDMQVEIQAYATEYSASSKIDLLNMTILDLVNYGSPQTIYEGSANIGEKSFTWGEVADALNGSSTTIDWWSNLAPHSYENMWYTNGWLYRIRLKSADDSYIGDWQIVYGITSAPPEDSETIYNYYYYYGGQGITDDVVDVLNNINTINNTQNIWYINNNPVDPSGGSSNWLETLLKFIADMIGRILDLFGTMFDSVLDFLLGLFEGFDPVGSFIDWWNQLKIKFNSIDLTLPWFNLPEDEDLSSFGVLVQKTVEIYTLNDLGFMIYIPLLLLILKVVFL